MKTFKKITHSLLAAFLCAALTPLMASAQTPEEIQQIEAAMPAKARVQPAQPRTLLVFSLCKGFAHSAVPYGAKALEIMGQKTGAFTCVQSSDPAVFAPDSLNAFDAIVINNATGELIEDPAIKQSFLNFVKGGKGIIGIHAATDACYQWPEYGEMMGGYFNGHPWGSGDTVTVKIDDPIHPLTQVFAGKGFDVKDEIYQIKDPYTRNNLRVLLSLNTAKTDMTKDGIKRTDGDFAVSWIRAYGNGRVFYCSLGHNHEIFWNAPLLQYYLDGIQYALGDLPADATPSAQMPAEYFQKAQAEAQQIRLDAILAELPAYTNGDPRLGFAELDEIIIAARDNAALRASIAAKLAKLLAADCTPDAKQYIVRELYVIGTDAEVPAIAPLLLDPATADMARYALERMPGQAADQALLDALGKTSGAPKTGIINTLGERRCQAAVPVLAALLSDPDQALAKAAATALGKIGNDAARDALAQAKNAATPGMLPAIADAYLLCADQRLAAGDKAAALAIYQDTYQMNSPVHIHIAAFQGIVAVQGENAMPLIAEALAGADPIMRQTAAGAARTIKGSGATISLVSLLPSLDASAQVLALQVLESRGDAAGRDAAIAAVKSANEDVRIAALQALAVLGDASIVNLLGEAAAAASSEPEKDAARDSLDRLRDANVDNVMMSAAKNGAAPQRAELIRSLAARNVTAAVSILIETAGDADEAVRVESFKALRAMAGSNELAALLNLLVTTQGDNARKEAERAVTAIAKKTPQADWTKPFTQVFMDNASNEAALVSLVTVSGNIGNDQLLPLVLGVAKVPGVQDTAVRALIDWPTPEPLPQLLEIAKGAIDPKYNLLALRGYIRMLGLPSKRSAAETYNLYKGAMDIAQRPEEKHAIIAGLANVRDKAVQSLLEICLNDPELKDEAQKALDQFKSVGFSVEASLNNDGAKKAIDGDPATRWETGSAMSGGEWFLIDLGWEQKVKKITLDATGSNGDYPRGYEVYASNNKEAWGNPIATGAGTGPITEITLEPAISAVYIKILQTGKSNGLFWSIHELRVTTE